MTYLEMLDAVANAQMAENDARLALSQAETAFNRARMATAEAWGMLRGAQDEQVLERMNLLAPAKEGLGDE